MTEHTAIRETLAAGPTEGPWVKHPHAETAVVGPGGYVVAACGGYSSNTRDPDELANELAANASFIIACNPTAIRSLLADFDTLRQRAERAEEDARRLDWMSEHQARIGWNREGDLCRVYRRNDDENDIRMEPVCGWDKFFDNPRAAIDAARTAIGETP